ncbi:MAG: hypothetical protein EPN91_04075 [Salinibacterium sp.]|nr:MAG: hypothetical protein EPN91_04075 [Salinibacterium sp.]
MTDAQVVDQPPPKATEGDIWRAVITDMEQRRETGISRYGTPLQAHNGRDAVVDAYQEALDLAVYLRQEIVERIDLRTAILRAATLLEQPHKHDWRPDLVQCAVELDALSILRAALR